VQKLYCWHGQIPGVARLSRQSKGKKRIKEKKRKRKRKKETSFNRRKVPKMKETNLITSDSSPETLVLFHLFVLEW